MCPSTLLLLGHLHTQTCPDQPNSLRWTWPPVSITLHSTWKLQDRDFVLNTTVSSNTWWAPNNSFLNEQRAPITCCQIITPYNCGITCCKLLELGIHFNENVTIKQDLGEKKVTNSPIIWILPLFIFTLQWTRSQQGTSFYNILFAFIQT